MNRTFNGDFQDLVFPKLRTVDEYFHLLSAS